MSYGEVKVVRRGLRWVACLPLEATVVMMFGPQLWSVLMSVASVTTKGGEARAAQSWSCPSLAATLGRTEPASHGCSTQEIRLCTSPGQRSRADPADRHEGELA